MAAAPCTLNAHTKLPLSSGNEVAAQPHGERLGQATLEPAVECVCVFVCVCVVGCRQQGDIGSSQAIKRKASSVREDTVHPAASLPLVTFGTCL
jgi:hypothetical protein